MSKNSALRHWLQLFRVPNLFTVPGDPLAGFLLAYGFTHAGTALLEPRAAVAVFASLCLYAAGLAMNDLCDFAEDQRERPDRPLTSGAISRRAASLACAALAFAGISAMAAVAGKHGLVAAVVLATFIALYNGGLKRTPVIGALMMGACRGLSLLLGSVACLGQIRPMPVPVFAGGVLIALYIAAVTNLARHETRASAPPLAKMLPLAPLLGALVLLSSLSMRPFQSAVATVLAAAVVIVSAQVGGLFRADAPPLPPVIGALIRVLLVVQAALCLVYPASAHAMIVAAGLLLTLPVARAVGRRFYAS
ncbi:MAG: UbiA family prenyltransferase [Chthoniobacteraceae bacterium]